MLLDTLIAAPRLLELDEAEIAAPPGKLWELVRHGELGQSPLIRALFAVRTLPARLKGQPADLSIRIDDLRSSPEQPGFQLLAEDAPREFAVGAIGKVWHVDIPFRHVAGAREFAAFAEPGFVKVAWAVRVQPLGERDSRLQLEVRVDATDDESWRKFQRYFRLIGPGSRFIRRTLLASLERELGTPNAREGERPLPGDERLPVGESHDVLEGIGGAAIMLAAFCSPFQRGARSHWGVTREVAASTHPGDELVPEPRWSWTHGVEIEADASKVWPWIAQLGADRAGFYSYQSLENLVGCNIRNADVVHPEWALEVGEELVLHPDPRSPRMKIVGVEPGRCLIAYAPVDEAARAANEPWATASWVFELQALGSERCRLVSRYRAACSDDLATRLAFGPTLLEPVGFAMDRRLLLGVKERAERHEPYRGAAPTSV